MCIYTCIYIYIRFTKHSPSAGQVIPAPANVSALPPRRSRSSAAAVHPAAPAAKLHQDFSIKVGTSAGRVVVFHIES